MVKSFTTDILKYILGGKNVYYEHFKKLYKVGSIVPTTRERVKERTVLYSKCMCLDLEDTTSSRCASNNKASWSEHTVDITEAAELTSGMFVTMLSIHVPVPPSLLGRVGCFTVNLSPKLVKDF